MNQGPRTGDAPEIRQVLWDSIVGGDYDIERLQREVDFETRLDEFLDSLDLTDFVLRLEHHYQINISQEDYARLNTLASIEDYVKTNSTVVARPTAGAAGTGAPTVRTA